MGALWFVVGLTLIVALTATYIIVKYVRNAEKDQGYERDYKIKLRALENRKAKAINARDDFEAHLADQDAIKLRERYIAREDLL